MTFGSRHIITSSSSNQPDGDHHTNKLQNHLCINCQKWGHIGAVCPKRNVLAVSTDEQENITPTDDFMPKLFLVNHSLTNSNIIKQLKQWNLSVPATSRLIVTQCFWGRSESDLTVVSHVSFQLLSFLSIWQ